MNQYHFAAGDSASLRYATVAAGSRLPWRSVDKDIMPLYIDTAKSFAALSSAALGVTVVFYEKIVGARPGEPVNRLMVASWFVYLLTIGSSALYQYLAVRFLDSISCSPTPASSFSP